MKIYKLDNLYYFWRTGLRYSMDDDITRDAHIKHDDYICLDENVIRGI